MFYKRKKVVHLNFKNAHGADAEKAAHSSKDVKEPHAASAASASILERSFSPPDKLSFSPPFNLETIRKDISKEFNMMLRDWKFIFVKAFISKFLGKY